MEEAHATVNALIARVDLCARMSGSQARCSGTALSFANEAGSVHVKARPLAINTEEAESMAFPFLVVEIVEGVPKPVQVTSLTELRQYLEGMAQALIVMASEYASNGIAQHTMDTVLGAVIHACATTHTQLDVYEASLAGDIMLGVENDISMQQATEHAAVINDVLAQYPQLQETLHPSMMDTEWKQNYRQYTGMTKEQLRAKNNKLFNMVKKFAKLMNTAVQKNRDEALDEPCLQLAAFVKHTVVLESRDQHKVVLLEIDASKPITVWDLEHTVIPKITDALAIVHSLDGATGFKCLVECDIILKELLQLLATTLTGALSEVPTYCDPVEGLDMTLSMGRASFAAPTNLIALCLEVLDELELLADDLKALEGETVPLPPFNIDEIAGPSSELNAPAVTVTNTDDIREFVDSMYPLLKKVQDHPVMFNEMTVLALKHLTRLSTAADHVRKLNGLAQTGSQNQLSVTATTVLIHPPALHSASLVDAICEEFGTHQFLLVPRHLSKIIGTTITLLKQRKTELEELSKTDTKGYLVDMIADMLLYDKVAKTTAHEALKERFVRYAAIVSDELHKAKVCLPHVTAEAAELAKEKHAQSKRFSTRHVQKSPQAEPEALVSTSTTSPNTNATPAPAPTPSTVAVSLQADLLHSAEQIECMMQELAEELDVAQLLEPEMLEISEQLTLLRGRKRRLERLCYKNPHKYLVDLLKDAFTYREAIKTCDEDKAAMLTCYLNAMGKEIQLAKDYMIDVYIHAERVARSQLHFLSEGE
eukprot:m.173580 g.173580  ORF g.173580 m.173580 type:complete len:766 (-) comp14586_c3_seq17:924-3221(-)